MNSSVVFIDTQAPQKLRPLLSGLDMADVTVHMGLPNEPHQPLIIMPMSPKSLEDERYRPFAYCLALDDPPLRLPNRLNFTYLSPKKSPEHLGSAIRDWVSWVKIDAQDSLMKHQLLGRAPVFCKMVHDLHAAAKFDAATLLTGETGTGKEVAARAIHHWSSRRDAPFVAINCGGQHDDLFMAELFGHERGAFTGAEERREGLITTAENGTLFLDEINSLSLKAQAALLRFMQDQTYRPIGSRRTFRSDVRIIAATNQLLRQLAEQGHFREDLFYRIEVLSVVLPPLRQRRQDIPILVNHFLRKFQRRYSVGSKQVDPGTMCEFMKQNWPGNVRELENYVHRLFVTTDGRIIRTFPTDMSPLGPDLETAMVENEDSQSGFLPFRDAKAIAIAHFEKSYLSQILHACHGNISAAARLAGKERRTFRRLIQKHGIKYKLDSVQATSSSRI